MEIILPTWLGSYFGCDFSFEQYECGVVSRFPQNIRNTQVKLLKTRWFDYTRLHPLQATYYFADCYRRIYQEKASKVFALQSQGIREDFMTSREATTFWNTRSFCDAQGYEYMWFLRTMIDYRLTNGEFKNRIPRICHLVRDYDNELLALDTLWKGRISGERLVWSKDPYFSAEAFVGDSTQCKHENFLMNQIKNKRIKRFPILELVFKQKVLRAEKVAEVYPDDLKDAEKEFARMGG